MDTRQMIYRLIAMSLFGLCLLSPVRSNAQLQDMNASAEDVAIAFFKTAGIAPDFDLWAKGTNEYKRTAPALVSDYLEREKQRLIRRWRDYNPEEDVLDVRGSVDVELQSTLDDEGTEQYWMYIRFTDGDITYFPYKFQEYKFAVIPQKIETMMIQSITREQFAFMYEEFDQHKAGIATMVLQLRPVKAYSQQPYDIDSTKQWALMADIATMTMIGMESQHPLWNYSADWYVSPAKQELQDLYNPTRDGTPLSIP